MYRCAVCQHITLHSLITFHHANMRGSSSRICVPKTFCHPRVMSRSLPHLTLTTSTSSLSPTSPILQSCSSTHPSLLSHDPYIHCDDSRRSCGSSDLQSTTDPKSPGRINVKIVAWILFLEVEATEWLDNAKIIMDLHDVRGHRTYSATSGEGCSHCQKSLFADVTSRLLGLRSTLTKMTP